MKILKYQVCTKINLGTEDEPEWDDVLTSVEMGWNEANEEIAKREAYNGEYSIEDDGVEPEPTTTLETRVEMLEATTDDMILLMADIIGG